MLISMSDIDDSVEISNNSIIKYFLYKIAFKYSTIMQRRSLYHSYINHIDYECHHSSIKCQKLNIKIFNIEVYCDVKKAISNAETDS